MKGENKMVYVTYVPKYYAKIVFDYCFDLDVSECAFTLDFLIDKAEQQFTCYPFRHADVVDVKTGEVLAVLEYED